MAYNPYSLEGKTILVTGASSGIGQTTAIECSKLGAKVIVTARNTERLQETFDQLVGEGHRQIIADISKEEDICSLVEQVPVLDGVVNNAGVAGTSLVTFYKKEEIESMFNTNTMAAVLITKMLVKKKKMNNPSSIVFTSSAEGVFGSTPANGVYGMTKAALNAFMQTAAIELGRKGIRCNTVNPSMVQTRMAIPTGAISAEQLEIDKKKYPLGRYGEPKDIAYAIIYLLSDAASWVTGTALKIDGGRNLVS
jgi:NAD(P)-dependent dehydrogenase (short-subunit alcohol dehydrogenase family)